MTDDIEKEPLAFAYDDTDGELAATIYTREVWAELEDVWWLSVFAASDDGDDGDDESDDGRPRPDIKGQTAFKGDFNDPDGNHD